MPPADRWWQKSCSPRSLGTYNLWWTVPYRLPCEAQSPFFPWSWNGSHSLNRKSLRWRCWCMLLSSDKYDWCSCVRLFPRNLHGTVRADGSVLSNTAVHPLPSNHPPEIFRHGWRNSICASPDRHVPLRMWHQYSCASVFRYLPVPARSAHRNPDFHGWQNHLSAHRADSLKHFACSLYHLPLCLKSHLQHFHRVPPAWHPSRSIFRNRFFHWKGWRIHGNKWLHDSFHPSYWAPSGWISSSIVSSAASSSLYASSNSFIIAELQYKLIVL